MSQKTRLSIAYGLSLMATALSINNSLILSITALFAATYLIRDLLMKKRNVYCLPFVALAGIINTLIYVLGFPHFLFAGQSFTFSCGFLIIFSMVYTYALLQANNRQLKKTVRIDAICCLAVMGLMIISDLFIRITLPQSGMGVLTGFWLLLAMMAVTLLSVFPVIVLRNTYAHQRQLARKMS
ncbi:MAG: hypothetical protein IJG49_03550 [Erysipelotrichaceae bacterium]|nr:hypothetical protein [Erysipelotrichaceae bacterium]